MSVFLHVERKRTDKIDLVKPLTKFIKNNYGDQDYKNNKDALDVVQQLREDVRKIQDRSDTSKDLVFR